MIRVTSPCTCEWVVKPGNGVNPRKGTVSS